MIRQEDSGAGQSEGKDGGSAKIPVRVGPYQDHRLCRCCESQDDGGLCQGLPIQTLGEGDGETLIFDRPTVQQPCQPTQTKTEYREGQASSGIAQDITDIGASVCHNRSRKRRETSRR